jgi:hypothetical protein
VLMLTGPMPVRVCTCAAAAGPSAPAREHTEPHPATVAKTCGCGHRAKVSPEHSVAAERATSCGHVEPDDARGHSHPDRHDRDCPAVNPRPAASAAVLTPAPDAPVDLGISVPLCVEPAGGGLTRATSRREPEPVVSAVPLYISLLTLRN